MKFLIVAFTLFTLQTQVSQAAYHTSLVESCKDAGFKKLREHALELGKVINIEKFKECGVEMTGIKYKYVWFCTEAYGKDGMPMKISMMTQKYGAQKCQ